MVTQDAETGKELARRDLVKGYEFEKDHYLILSEEDFDSVRVDSSSVMNIEKFVEGSSINPIYYDGAYYLASDGLDDIKLRNPFQRLSDKGDCLAAMWMW